MIEGGGSRDFAHRRRCCRERPAGAAPAARKLARATTDYLNAQIAAGAQAVMIFDTWGGVLSTPAVPASSRCAYMEQHRRADSCASAKAGACRSSCSPRAAAPGSTTWRRRAAMRSASTGRRSSRLRAARSATASRCRATSIPAALYRIARGDPRAGRARARELRPRPRPRLQPRPRHPARRRPRARHRAGRRRARALAGVSRKKVTLTFPGAVTFRKR